MNYQLSAQQVSSLFCMHELREIELFIKLLLSENRDGWNWLPLGGLENNAGNVRVSEEPGPPIVERVVNAQEAMLELAYVQAGSPKPGPLSPRKAAEEWFGVPGGVSYSTEANKEQVKKLASNVRVDVYKSGLEKRPSIAIRDRGIGQHPEDLPSTILSLGGRSKIDKLYLPGVFGQGGSSTYAWCKYSIIISRRRPEHAKEKSDLVGWTIVREKPFYKTYIYEYLVTRDQKIPTFPPSHLEGTGFDFGTYIIHIAYDLGRLGGPWSRTGYPYLNNLLFDPVLPYIIDDNRYHDDPKYKVREMTMYGSRERLSNAVARYSNDIYNNEYTADLGSEGVLKLHYWVFKKHRHGDHGDEIEEEVYDEYTRKRKKPPKIKSYLESERSNHTVIITLNGQRHGNLEKSFIREAVGSSLVADRLLMQVDCDDLSLELKRDLITSVRTGIRTGEHLDLIKDCVRRALEDPELRRIKSELLQQEFAVAGEGDEEARKILDRLVRVTKLEQGPGPRKGTDKGQRARGRERFRPKDPPTYFRFAEEKQVLEIEPGTQRFIDIRTDGPDNMLTRSRRKAKLTLEVISDSQSIFMRRGSLREGRLSITVLARETASVGTLCTLRAELEMDGGVYIPPTERRCKVVAPPPPYIGREPPTELHIATKGDCIKLKQGRTTQILVRTDCQDDLLSRPRQPGKLEVDCSIEGVRNEAIRGPRRGQIEIQLQAPQSLPIGKTGDLKTALILANGTMLEDKKPCTIVESPPTEHRGGQKQVPGPNYRFIEVWRQPLPEASNNFKTWDDMDGWDETIVGHYHYDKQDGEESLIFYINMDFAELAKERERRLNQSGESAIRAFKSHYKAYIAYHLYQLFERFRQDYATSSKVYGEELEQEAQVDEEAAKKEEMPRVAKTVILAMRSQRELLEALKDID